MNKLMHADFKKKALQNIKVKQEYDRLEEEFSLISMLIKARKKKITFI